MTGTVPRPGSRDWPRRVQVHETGPAGTHTGAGRTTSRPVPVLTLPVPEDPQTGAATWRRRPISRQLLLRRLVRLDVTICWPDAGPVTVQSGSGATAAVPAGRWSDDAIRELLAQLGLSEAAFQDSQ